MRASPARRACRRADAQFPRSRDRARAACRAGQPERVHKDRGWRAPGEWPADAARRPTDSSRSGHADGNDGDFARAFIEHGHVNLVGALIGVAPQAEQRPMAGGKLADGNSPAALGCDHARPGPVMLDPAAFDHVDQCGHRPIRAAWRRSGTTPPAPVADRRRQRRRSPDGQTSARKTPWPRRSRRAVHQKQWS